MKQTLFAVFLSIAVLIGGVVLLTSKKPEPKLPAQPTILGPVPRNARRRPKATSTDETAIRQRVGEGEEEDDALRLSDDDEAERDAVMWQIGDDEDEEDGLDGDAKHATGSKPHDATRPPPPAYHGGDEDDVHEEVRGLISAQDGEDSSAGHAPEGSGDAARTTPPITTVRHTKDDDDDFGEWEDGAAPVTTHR